MAKLLNIFLVHVVVSHVNGMFAERKMHHICNDRQEKNIVIRTTERPICKYNEYLK